MGLSRWPRSKDPEERRSHCQRGDTDPLAHAIAVTMRDLCPAEQDLLQLGRTTHCTSSDRMQRNGFQRGDKKALVTPLVTKFGRHSQPTTPLPTTQESNKQYTIRERM